MRKADPQGPHGRLSPGHDDGYHGGLRPGPALPRAALLLLLHIHRVVRGPARTPGAEPRARHSRAVARGCNRARMPRPRFRSRPPCRASPRAHRPPPPGACALLQASGAGKTTLLKAIAGEAAEGVLTGDVQVNGHAATTDELRRISGFVFQDDLLMPTMTVREAILFSARLRLPGSMPLQEKEARVQQVIELLHLGGCADTLIGSALTKGGISGGEKKRVAIGMELITNPPILFLDEPTTGLDTYTAYSVMSTLKALAASGRTVV